jgi:hypothetical protein
LENHYPEKIIAYLEAATQPMDVEKIRVDLGMGNWNTVLKHCLQLVMEKKIRGLKTSKSWVFWIEKAVTNS